MFDRKFFAMAFEALLLDKVRSALTMLGVIIGVMSVIVLIDLGQSSQAYITNQVQGLGAGVLVVTPGNAKSQAKFGPPGVGAVMTLSLNDAKVLGQLPGVLVVSPNAFTQAVFKAGRNAVTGVAGGTAPAMLILRGFILAEGRFFTEQEGNASARVIVLGGKIARELYAGTPDSALGHMITIKDRRFRVIGVLAEQGSGLLGSTDDQAFMPIRTFQTIILGGERVNTILLKAETAEGLSAMQTQARGILRQRHGLRPHDEDDFNMSTQSEILATVGTITSAFTVLLAGIAAISLVVGGIGIMNIMLVSVSQRTREIGVRKAVGAKRRDILTQFLIEASGLSIVGGILGMALGVGLGWAIARATQLPFIVSPAALGGGFLFSAAVGIFFGLYPANQAAKLDPVTALHAE